MSGYLVNLSLPWWDKDKRQKEVKLVGRDKNSLVIEIKYSNSNNNSNNIINSNSNIIVIIIVMKREERERNKTQEKQSTLNTILHHPLTHPSPKLNGSRPISPVHIWSMMF